MLELVFVIVVIGILAAVMIPRTKSNKLQEAAIQLISHIRYTQHLAMIDDKFKSDDATWYKERWQLILQKSNNHTDGKYAYTIFSDKISNSSTAQNGMPNTTNGEIALDPFNNDKYLSGGTQSLNTNASSANRKMNLGLSYGIDNYQLHGGCSGTRISFDNMGRPISGDLKDYSSAYILPSSSKKLISSTCRITLISASEGNISIYIEPETGYTHLLKL